MHTPSGAHGLFRAFVANRPPMWNQEQRRRHPPLPSILRGVCADCWLCACLPGSRPANVCLLSGFCFLSCVVHVTGVASSQKKADAVLCIVHRGPEWCMILEVDSSWRDARVCARFANVPLTTSIIEVLCLRQQLLTAVAFEQEKSGNLNIPKRISTIRQNTISQTPTGGFEENGGGDTQRTAAAPTTESSESFVATSTTAPSQKTKAKSDTWCLPNAAMQNFSGVVLKEDDGLMPQGKWEGQHW